MSHNGIFWMKVYHLFQFSNLCSVKQILQLISGICIITPFWQEVCAFAYKHRIFPPV